MAGRSDSPAGRYACGRIRVDRLRRRPSSIARRRRVHEPEGQRPAGRVSHEDRHGDVERWPDLDRSRTGSRRWLRGRSLQRLLRRRRQSRPRETAANRRHRSRRRRDHRLHLRGQLLRAVRERPLRGARSARDDAVQFHHRALPRQVSNDLRHQSDRLGDQARRRHGVPVVQYWRWRLHRVLQRRESHQRRLAGRDLLHRAARRSALRADPRRPRLDVLLAGGPSGLCPERSGQLPRAAFRRPCGLDRAAVR